jgi:hypothetical protein
VAQGERRAAAGRAGRHDGRIRRCEPVEAAVKPLPCDARTPKQIDELVTFVARDKQNAARLSQVRTQLVEKHCLGCHSDFDLRPDLDASKRDETVLRFLLGQDGWLYPGDPLSGRLRTRVRGIGAELIMPPADGRELLKQASYQQLLQALDQLVATMVPGERRRMKLGQLVQVRLRDRHDRVCGSLLNATVVVVVDRSPKEKPGFSRIFRPADQFLNGECADDDGYYVPEKYLGPA